MNIVYFANGKRGFACLKAMLESSFIPLAVVLHQGDDKENPTKKLSDENNIEVIAPEKINSKVVIEKLANLGPDLFVMSGYGKILKHGILSIPRRGTINLHGGTLPKYRGGSPINWQIINGEKFLSCTILFADEGIDTGDILAEEVIAIGENDTAGELIEQTLAVFPPLLITILKKFELGDVQGKAQDILAGSYYRKRYPADGGIDWCMMSDVDVHSLVRGLRGESLPGAFTYLEGKKVAILKSSLLRESYHGASGQILADHKSGVIVIASNRGLLVEEVSFGECVNPKPARGAFKLNGARFV